MITLADLPTTFNQTNNNMKLTTKGRRKLTNKPNTFSIRERQFLHLLNSTDPNCQQASRFLMKKINIDLLIDEGFVTSL